MAIRGVEEAIEKKKVLVVLVLVLYPKHSKLAEASSLKTI